MINYTKMTENEGFHKLSTIFENKLVELKTKNKMFTLWISYLRMVRILKDFIAADSMRN